jgi:nicotinamide riboside kinase
VPIPEIMKFKDDDIVRIASSCDEFVTEVKSALSESPSENIMNKRMAVAKNNSWDNRAKKMIDIVKAYGN